MLVWAVWLSILLNLHTEKDNRQTYTQQCTIHTLVHFLPLQFTWFCKIYCLYYHSTVWDSFSDLYLCSTHKLWKVKSIVKVSCMLRPVIFLHVSMCKRKRTRYKCQGNLLKQYSSRNMGNGGGKTPPHVVLCKDSWLDVILVSSHAANGLQRVQMWEDLDKAVWNHKEKIAFKHTHRTKHQMPTSTSRKHQGKWLPQNTSLISCVRSGKQWRPGDTIWLGLSSLHVNLVGLYFWEKTCPKYFIGDKIIFLIYLKKHFFLFLHAVHITMCISYNLTHC